MNRRIFLASAALLLLTGCFDKEKDYIEFETWGQELLKDPDIFYIQLWELSEDEAVYHRVLSLGDKRYDVNDTFVNSDFAQEWSLDLIRKREIVAKVTRNHPWFTQYWEVEEKDFELHFNAVGTDTKYRFNYFKRINK